MKYDLSPPDPGELEKLTSAEKAPVVEEAERAQEAGEAAFMFKLRGYTATVYRQRFPLPPPDAPPIFVTTLWHRCGHNCGRITSMGGIREEGGSMVEAVEEALVWIDKELRCRLDGWKHYACDPESATRSARQAAGRAAGEGE